MAPGSSSRLKQRRSAASQSLNLSLRFGWIVLVIWCEIGEFFWQASTCQWGKLERRLLKSTSRRSRPARSTRVLVISDPQVINFNAPTFVRRPVRSKITQFILDTFLRKSWMVAKRFRPDAVFITGDMMHSGRQVASEGEYWAYANHFKAIFETPDAPPIFYVPGNRDVGLAPSRQFDTRARDRYREAFGPINYTLDLGNHTFVMLDAPGMIEEDYRRYAAQVRFGEWADTESGTITFVHELGEIEPHHPRILMSHVPLYRPERVDCGPNRERGFMTADAGLGYQKLFGQETSDFIMNNIRPTLAFSGEDHDVCELTHSNGVREVTVKTFSTGMGITHPGFQMLSLVPADPEHPSAPTHADMSCNLPDQLGIYSQIYVPLAFLTLVVLLVVNVRRSFKRRRPAYLNLNGLNDSAGFGGTSSSTAISPNPVRRTSTMGALKSPRIPATGLMAMGGMTPLLGPSTFRRASSRSVPPSPFGSPRIGFVSELPDEESDAAAFAAGSNGGSIYGQHAGYADESSQSASPVDEEGAIGNSYFLPLPTPSANGSSANLPSSIGLGLGLSQNNGSTLGLGTSRPGQARRVTRMSEKDSRALSIAAGEQGFFSSLWDDLRSAAGCSGDDRGKVNPGRDGLLSRWCGESWRVFWPAAATFALINVYFTI